MLPHQNLAAKDVKKKKWTEKPRDAPESIVKQNQSELLELLSTATDMEDQLRRLHDELSLTDEDNRIRNRICAQLHRLLSPFFESCIIYQFGSSINNFGAKKCDLDLFIDLQSYDGNSRHAKPSIRLPFHRDLASVRFMYGPLTAEDLESFDTYDKTKLISRMIYHRDGPFYMVHPIPCKRCPLVKFNHVQSGLSCDLSFNNRKALYNSRLLRLYGTNPVVKSFVMAVRHWAKVQEVAGNSSCGISSYAMTWMALFFLMYRQPQVIPKVWDLTSSVRGIRAIVIDSWKMLEIPLHSQLPPSVQGESPVDLLREFFHFCANEIDWNSTALLTSNATFIPLESLSDHYPQCQVGLMTMLDPFDLSHNVLQRVNESSKFRFIQEVERAAKLSHQWPSLSLDTVGKPWGIATLFVPSHPDALALASQKPPKKSQKRKRKDSAANDQKVRHSDYVINFSSAQSGHLGDHKTWYALVKRMLLNILQNVFMADVKQEGSYCLPCNKENDIETKDEKQQAFKAKGTDVKDSDHPVPLETSLDETSERVLKAGCLRAANNTEESYVQQSLSRTEANPVSLSPSTSSSAQQFVCNNESKSLPPAANVSQVSSCNGKSFAKDMKDKAVNNSVNKSSHPVFSKSQVKRSRVDACLDQSTDSDSDIHKYPPLQGEDSEISSSESVSKKIRFLENSENEIKDRANNEKSHFDTIPLKLEQVSEVKRFDPSVPQVFQKNLGTEVSLQHLPSLLQQSAKAEGFVSVSTYSCSCSIPVWHGRNKVRTLVMKSNKTKLQGLALEREVSRELIKTTDVGAETSSKAIVDNDLERRKKRSLLRSLKGIDAACEEANHSRGGLSDAGSESISDKALTSTSSPEDGEILQFSCEIIEKYIPQSGNRVVQIRFYPLSQHENSFKNFFSCGASMMTRLVTKNLSDVLEFR